MYCDTHIYVHVFGSGALNEFSGCGIPSLLSLFHATFLKHCGRCENHGGTSACFESVAGGKQWHAACELFYYFIIIYQYAMEHVRYTSMPGSM